MITFVERTRDASTSSRSSRGVSSRERDLAKRGSRACCSTSRSAQDSNQLASSPGTIIPRVGDVTYGTRQILSSRFMSPLDAREGQLALSQRVGITITAPTALTGISRASLPPELRVTK